ncbi:alpha/beta hydrolase family protein [Streptantibioticus ferralitis]|uniref:Prolyl oligopeptidase family serine peptidase n=1 Tax=Streptantibioticus ferralitis TaxID=236510 RepID=A0ABT5YW99_9ACTN|nr:prolyl oligopeptidase family serine peptidase [Streptantibioticus ferralitis]MDF2255861.1 prolyl oligopeptidase family serine peptidase [Streptantibioticus ferralitis]
MTHEPISGLAAGVPFTALPPTAPGPASMVVTWHMIGAPRTDAAFAAALPMAGVPAWRVHLGMPLCGARMRDGSMDAVVELTREDAVLAYEDPFVRQAAEEFPAALGELRERLSLPDGPIGVVGGSLGGAVALHILASAQTPIAAAAVVNAAIRARSVVSLIEQGSGQPYTWTPESRAAADRLDFVANADAIAARTPQPPLLVVSGDLDSESLRADAVELVDALKRRYAKPDHVELLTVPGLAHALAELPGLEPAPQTPTAKVVDEAITRWFVRHLAGTPV